METIEPGAVGDHVAESPIVVEQPDSASNEQLLRAAPGELIIGVNARTQSALTKWFVADIKRRGVRQPVIAHRRDDGALVVREGQRRTLAAIEAGLATVPVVVTKDPVSTDDKADTVERIVDQLGENEHRAPLSESDELAATQQLLDLGLSARQIAARRSISRSRATNTAAVARSTAASQAVADHGLDLVQAAIIAEFDDDEAAQTELRDAATARPEQLQHIAQRWRDQRAEEHALTARTTELTEQGLRVIDRPFVFTDGLARLSNLRPSPQNEPGTTALAAEDHAECPGHAVFLIYSRRTHDIEVVPVCTDFITHGHAELRAPAGETTTRPNESGTGRGPLSEHEREAKKTHRRTVIAHGKAWDSATQLRRAWLSRFAARKTAPKDAPVWTAQTWASGAHCLRKALESGHELAGELLGIPGGRADIVRAAEQATAARATVITTVLALAAIEASTDRRHTWEHPDALQRSYFARIQQWGYEPADVEALVTTAHDNEAAQPVSECTDDADGGEVAEAA